MRHASLLLLLACFIGLSAAEPAAEWRFAKDVAAYEAKDKEHPPAAGTIEFIGSSTFTRWSTLAQDMAPLPVYNRAFGGSAVGDMLRAAPRLVLPYKPRVVVYYCGDNNMTDPVKADPAVPVKGFTDFVAAVRAELPATRFIYVSIKPSPSRWANWPKVSEANAQLKALCAGDPLLTYVDIAPALLDGQGQPIESLYVKDRLHTTAEGYARITAILKPVVEKVWAAANTR